MEKSLIKVRPCEDVLTRVVNGLNHVVRALSLSPSRKECFMALGSYLASGLTFTERLFEPGQLLEQNQPMKTLLKNKRWRYFS